MLVDSAILLLPLLRPFYHYRYQYRHYCHYCSTSPPPSKARSITVSNFFFTTLNFRPSYLYMTLTLFTLYIPFSPSSSISPQAVDSSSA